MIKKMGARLLFFILLVGVVLSIPAWSVPLMINVQGRLTDPRTGNAKVPITGTAVTFTIYEDLTARWSEVRPVNPALDPTIRLDVDSNGIFNVILGTRTSINVDFTSSSDYFLGVKVGSDSEMSPQQQLVSVPFAITAKNLKGGSVEAIGDPAVKGSVPGTSTNYGELGRKIASIFITDVTTVGVYGKAQGEKEVAVMGENYAPGSFIGSKIYYGRGVAGSGKVGVYGYGTVAGGSFESTSTSGIGVYGGGGYKGVFGENRSTGIGVHGKGVSGPGGKFESSSGPALEIGPGWLKMPIATATWNSTPNTPTINSNAGIIDFNGATAPAGFWLTVNCDRVRSTDAIVMLQSMRGVSVPKVKEIHNPVNTFKVWCENGDDIGFIVINSL